MKSLCTVEHEENCDFFSEQVSDFMVLADAQVLDQKSPQHQWLYSEK